MGCKVAMELKVVTSTILNYTTNSCGEWYREYGLLWAASKVVDLCHKIKNSSNIHRNTALQSLVGIFPTSNNEDIFSLFCAFFYLWYWCNTKQSVSINV